MDLMIDTEGLGTGPETTLLTLAAQEFDPFDPDRPGRHYYARITLESQENRRIEQTTLDWWAQQDPRVREEAFAEDNRLPLRQVLEEFHRLAWHADRIWAQGPTYDITILEHCYRSFDMPTPWRYYKVRDSRTVLALWPDVPKPETTHHALEDCRRQITMLQATLRHLGIREMR